MDNVKIDFSGEIIELENVLIGGRAAKEPYAPMSLYGGKLNLDELHNSLYYINRAVIHLLVNEFEIDLEEVDGFLLSALSESLVKEYNLQSEGRSDANVHKVVSKRKNNQDFF